MAPGVVVIGMSAPSSHRVFAALGVAALLALFVAGSFHSVCDLNFGCGCEPLWAGAAMHCNIHHHNAPHCPWCTSGPRLLWVLCLIAAPVLLPVVAVARRRLSPAGGFAVGLVGYGLIACGAGLVTAIACGYPRWLGLQLPFAGPLGT